MVEDMNDKTVGDKTEVEGEVNEELDQESDVNKDTEDVTDVEGYSEGSEVLNDDVEMI